MAKTAEQILRAQGLNDADIAAMSTLLSDARYRAAIETPFNSLETERDTWQARSQEFEQLRESEYIPAVTRAEKEAQEYRLKNAELEERVRIAKDYGYLGDDDAQRKADEAAARARAAAAPQSQPGGFNPDDPKFRDFAGKFSTAEGDSIALHNFLAEEYRSLHGQSVNEYKATVDGREMRGLPALRAEARKANQGIDIYMESKFDWGGKRNAAAAERQKQYEETIRRDEREKIALNQPMSGNPMSGRPVISKAPWVPNADPAKGGMPAMPWDSPTRTSERIERAYKSEVSSRTH